jgi:hypothetical protein
MKRGITQCFFNLKNPISRIIPLFNISIKLITAALLGIMRQCLRELQMISFSFMYIVYFDNQWY